MRRRKNNFTQAVRIFDIVLLGPGLIYYSQRSKDQDMKNFLLADGVGTILYNGFNFLRNA